MLFLNGSALAQATACCLTAPNHHLNQWWCITIVSCGTNLRAISRVFYFLKMIVTFCITGGTSFSTATSLNCLITNLWIHDRNTTSIIQDTISRLLRQYPECWHKATFIYKEDSCGSYHEYYIRRRYACNNVPRFVLCCDAAISNVRTLLETSGLLVRLCHQIHV